jgi:hypothetical protein
VTATAAAIATATPTPTLALAVVPAQLLPGGFGALFVFVFASAVVALFVSVAVVLLTGDDDDAEPTDDDEEDERVATTLDVVVEDAVIGEPFARPVTFVAEPTGADEQGRGGTGRNEPVVVDSPTGEATIELPLGEWELTASDDAGEIDAATVGTLDSELYLTASPWQINLTLRGGDERGPLVPDAAVRAAPDLGDPVTARSDPTGRVTLRVPRSADETTLVVDANGYETQRRTTAIRADVDGTLSLPPRSGTLGITTTVAGRPTRTTVLLEPVSTTHPVDARRVQTAEDGTATVEEVPVGEYHLRAGADVASDGGGQEGNADLAVGTASATVTLRPGERADASLSIPFEFEPTPRQRAELDRLRRRVAGLDPGEGRDGTVPKYFASVLTQLLDTIAATPERGDVFAEHDQAPGPAVDALLAVAGDAVSAVESAMAADRCVARFETCAGLAPAQIAWEGSYDLRTFLAFADHPAEADDRLAARLDAVQETIDVESDLVADAAPATETVKRVRRRLTPHRNRRPEPNDDARNSPRGPDAGSQQGAAHQPDGDGSPTRTAESGAGSGDAGSASEVETTTRPGEASVADDRARVANGGDRNQGQGHPRGSQAASTEDVDLEVAARVFAAAGLLEAVEDLFARPDLRRRLEYAAV